MAIDPVGEIYVYGTEMARIGGAPVSIQVLSGATEIGQSLGVLVPRDCRGHKQVGASLGEERP